MRRSMIWFAVGGVIAILSGCAGRSPEPPAAEEVALIPRQELLGNPERYRGRISPDGATMSFVAPLDGVLNLWVAPVGEIEAARALTRDTGRGIRLYQWAADGEHILYLQDEGGNENWQIHAVAVDGGEARNLTPIEGVQARIMAASWEHPREILVGLNDRDPRWHDVYRVDIVTGERRLVEKNEGIQAYVADRGLELRLAVESTPDGGSDLYRRDGSGGWERFATVPPDDAITTFFTEVAADGTTAYGIDSRGRNTAALVALDIPSGEVEVLGADDRADVEQILTHPETGAIQAYAVNHARREWRAVDQGVAAGLERIAAELGGDVVILDQTRAGDQWILYSDRPDAPGLYYLFDRGSGRLEPLFSTRPALDGYRLAATTDHLVPARDGLPLVSYLTLPAGSDPDGDGVPTEPVAMVLLVHGGPWGRDVYAFDGEVQWLANRGYAVLQVNFRSSTGFGKAHVNAGDREWGRAMHQDLLDAVDWAVARGVAPAERVAIMGGSYGGYATLAGLTFSPERFAAGVDIVGPSNLETLLASIPPYWTSLYDLFARRVGDPRTEEGRALLAEHSPLFRADRIVRPLLIAQGANDPRVKQAESDQIVAAMTGKGLPVTYVLYPDEGHGFVRPANRLSFYAVAEAFLAVHLGGRHQPLTPEDLEGASLQVPAGAQLVPGLAEALAAAAPEEAAEPVPAL